MLLKMKRKIWNWYDIISMESDYMTIIYFIRHSEALKSNNIKNSDSLQVQNEKWPVTEKGENIAKKK